MAATLYLRHFGLTRAPFPVTPSDDAFYVGGSRKATFDALMHVLLDEHGIVKVVGEAGTGKTTLCRQITRELRERYTVVYTCDPSLGGDQTWFALADALRLTVDRTRPADAAVAVRSRIGALHDQGRTVLLLIDEAHALATDTREQFRLLAQRDTGGECMRIALFGPDELDHSLALPPMDALRTRIVHSLRVKTLRLTDIAEYLQFRMTSSGWSGGEVFSDNAVRAIAKLTGGIPRRINLIADKALLSAATDRRHAVGARDVASAADEIKLERRRADVRPRGFAVGAFAGGVLASALVAAVAWFALRPVATPPATAATPTRTAPAGPTATVAAPGAAPVGASSKADGTIAPAQAYPTPLVPAPAADDAGRNRAHVISEPARGSTKDPADLSASSLTFGGDLPPPRFVQDIGGEPAPRR